MKKNIYVKNDNNIERFSVFIDEKELLQIKEILDEFHMNVKEYSFIQEMINGILKSNGLKASYLLNKLYSYAYVCKTEPERTFLDDVISCFKFEKQDKKFDLVKLLLEFERALTEDDVSMPYAEDETISKTSKLPYIYTLTKKHE